MFPLEKVRLFEALPAGASCQRSFVVSIKNFLKKAIPENSVKDANILKVVALMSSRSRSASG
jgi:hypothetical protein